MKAIVIERFGNPAEVARCVERPDPPPPGPGELRLRVLAANINPADLLLIEGNYGQLPTLPATPGAECVARVEAIGDGVAGFAVGDLVMPMTTSCWREVINAKSATIVALPAGIDVQQAAMLKANPATALAMLEDIVVLEPGDWVIQNAANSAVGRYVAMLAQTKGLRSIGIVRRPELLDALRREGADAVILDDWTSPAELAQRVKSLTGGKLPRLALDAVGGTASSALAAALADGGTIVNYGLLSGAACQVSPHDLVFRDIRLHGFWLARWFRQTPPDRIKTLYRTLVALVADGTVSVPIAASYPFSRIAQALDHAARAGRDGKIQLVAG